MASATAPGSPLPDVVAAGAVVVRKGRKGYEVLLVHRPRYDDWSFPKGKLDPGEHLTECAVREVEEETGLRVRLGVRLPEQRYRVSGDRMKTVHYWMGRVEGSDDLSGYEVNKEIDAVAWVPWGQAMRQITYRRDRDVLQGATPVRSKTRTLVVLRHGHAHPRGSWTDPDWLRPLQDDGREQAEAVVPVLAAYGVTTVATSTSTRCVQTVEPYAQAVGRPLQRYAELSEEEASPAAVSRVVAHLVDQAPRAVLCSHRPVLPSVFEALGLPATKLAPGSMVVVHHRKGEVVATEHHPAG